MTQPPAAAPAPPSQANSRRPSTSSAADRGGIALADAIDEIGFGWYQVQVFILSAGFIIVEGCEIQMASALTNAIGNEFGIATRQGRLMLVTSTFLGFAAGTVASGPLGDIYGRRAAMLTGYVGVVTSALVTCFVPTVSMVYLMRFILGFFGGIGVPAAFITVAEVSPRALRGASTAALGIASCLGDLWAALGFCFLMPDLRTGHWRYLVLWAVFPAKLLLSFGILSPVSRHDTPYFLAAQGRGRELAEAVALIATLNGRPHLGARGDGLDVTAPQASKYASLWRAVPLMLRRPLALHTAVLCLLFFGKDFTVYGMVVFWPVTWAKLNVVAGTPAQELLMTAALGVPGVFIAIWAVLRMPRRVALALGSVCCAVGVLLIEWLRAGQRVGILGVLLFKLLFPTYQSVIMLLPSELFPTRIRSWAYGTVAVFGRFSCVLAPLVVERSQSGFLGATALLGLASAAGAFWLPETKDCDLAGAAAEPAGEPLAGPPEASAAYGSAGVSAKV